MHSIKNDNYIKKIYIKVFFSAFFMFIIGVLPILIVSKGRYLFFSDYNAQIIPYWRYINESVKNGVPIMDYNLDLGNAFFTSFSFYGLTSPYTWLSMLFPENALPYGITFINALKFAAAALGTSIYCKRYVQSSDSIYLCGLLYAFSGQQLFNMVYHFADSVSLFPFLLFAFDELIYNKRTAFFAFMTAICAVTNYYFFFGEVVFVIIYYIVKIAAGEIKFSVAQFGKISLEAVLGTLCAAIVLIPSFISILNIPRASNTVFDDNFLAYENSGTVLKIIQSMFFEPDFMANGLIFNVKELNAASVSLYIPFFTVIGVAAVMKRQKRSWENILLYICMIFAAFPILNSIFSAFNSNYYARWFFMPLLVMVMLTGKYIDNIDDIDIRSEYKITAVITGIFTVYSLYLLIRKKILPSSGDFRSFSFYSCLFSVISLVFLGLYKYPYKGSSLSFKALKKTIILMCVIPFIMQSYIISFLAFHGDNVIDGLYENYNYPDGFYLDDSDFFRISHDVRFNPATYLYGYPSIDLFSSTVSGYSTEFWKTAGRYRESNAAFTSSDYAARTLLSVKYFLYFNPPLHGNIDTEYEDVGYKQESFEKYKKCNKYILYKNKNFIPIGFTFDYYINEDELEKFQYIDTDTYNNLKGLYTGSAAYGNKDNEEDESEEVPEVKKLMKNQKIMLKAIVLDNEQIGRYSDILSELPDELKDDTTYETYESDCEARRKSAGYFFQTDKTGFTSKIRLDKDNLVFYSVTYDQGYTAFVDGKITPIEKVDGGLCAVKVPKGDHTVRFEYEIPGFKAGAVLSVTGASLLCIYCIIARVNKSKKKAD